MNAVTPSVSVILPVYNRSATLRESMRSVLVQSYEDLELIVVDDCSTEDIKQIVDSFDDPRVVYTRHEVNGGVSAARNTGLGLARGTYIAFQDSDDLWLPQKLEKQVALMEELGPNHGAVTHSKVLYGGAADGTYGPGKVSLRPPPAGRLMPGQDQVAKFLVQNRISLQNALFRRDCYPTMPWFDAKTRSNADWAFTVSLAQHSPIAEYPDPVVMAFSSPDGISKNKRHKTIGTLRILRRNREAYGRYPKAEAEVRFRLGRALSKIGKRKLGRKFVLDAIRRDPALLVGMIRSRLGLA